MRDDVVAGDSCVARCWAEHFVASTGMPRWAGELRMRGALRRLVPLAFVASVFVLGTAQRARADSQRGWIAEHRPLFLATTTMQALGIESLVGAAALETRLLVQSSHGDPGPRYRRMQRATGPLAGVGSVFTVVSMPLSAVLYEMTTPDYVDGALLLSGVAAVIVGVALWAQPSDSIEGTRYREPIHQGGSVLFSAGLPMILRGASHLYVKALGRAYGTGH